jgi:sulfate transport system permease protein
MSGAPTTNVRRGELPSAPQILEPRWVRAADRVALLFLTLFLFVPLVAVFTKR